MFGPPPVQSPSLADLPQGDVEVKRLAREIWGDCDGAHVFSHPYGQGRVLWRSSEVKPGDQYGDYADVTNVIAAMGVPPDFTADAPVSFTHRRDGDADIYFLVNCTSNQVQANGVFRILGKSPALFDPLTGEIRALPQFSENASGTVIPLRMEAGQSYFVIFRSEKMPPPIGSVNFPELNPLLALSGPWEVSFDPKWGGPAQVTFDALTDWSQSAVDGIKFYSGKAVYRKTFVVPPASLVSGQKYFLDLGEVKNLARVRLNGRDCGVVWCPPWRTEVTAAMLGGTNQLEVEVANLWPNRLIGDLSLPEEKRFTWTTRNPFKPTATLLPSGLLGPVRLISTQ